MPARGRLLGLLLAGLLVLSSAAVRAEDAADLSGLDIGDLQKIEVVTPSRRSEPLNEVAGAITVLTEEDIRRSGATTLPEVLRLVPGVHVGRVDTEKWAVGIRGFNGLLENKNLVLLDGRPLTSPFAADVDWSNQSVPLETIERIEVVRGAWTSLWGADSFTGVINIVTKPASATQGAESVSLAGNEGLEQSLRYGGRLGEDAFYRVYGKTSYKTGQRLGDDPGHGSWGSRDWAQNRGGFRVDWNNAFTDQLSLQGDLVGAQFEEGMGSIPQMAPPGERSDSTGYCQLTWDRATGLGTGLHFRTSFTRGQQTVGDLRTTTNVWDAEFQDAMETEGVHRLTWGLGVRHNWDSFESGSAVHMDQPNFSHTETSAFAQDKITLLPERLFLILGSKFDYLGRGSVEVQPTVRLLHTQQEQEFWAAVSRSVREPNLWQNGGGYMVHYHGNDYQISPPDGLGNEELVAYEAGYRRHLDKTLSFDFSLFANDYDRLTKLSLDQATHTGRLTNSLSGMAYGAESLLEWQALSWLTLRPSVSLIQQDFREFTGDERGDSLPKENTVAEAKLMAMSDLGHGFGLDFLFAYLDSPTENSAPGYCTLDGHLSWKASEHLRLELIGQNLLGAQQEFSFLSVDTSLSLRVTWDF